MVKKLMGIAVVTIMLFSVFGLGGCSSIVRIIDFEGLKDLPRNPSRIVFATNSQTFDEETVLYGEPIEYEIQSAKIAEVTEKLFVISYKALDKNIQIDMSPIIRTLTFFNTEGAKWTVQLGLRRHNERWYSPIQDDDLIALLYGSITIENK